MPFASGTRLVGGTALALQYGHRNSIDLDFFGRLTEDCEEMEQALRDLGRLQILKSTPKIRVYQVDNVKVDFVDYSRYNWIDAAVCEDGIVLASPKDIAAMKVNAIEGRGTKKDFIDIYALLHRYSLDSILGFYSEKYPEHSIFRAIMSLSYFNDADEQISPQTFDLPTWEEMKAFIQNQISKHKV